MISRITRSMILAATVAVGLAATPSWGDIPANAERVLVIPFAALNVPGDQQWISKGVEETIVADLGRAGAFAPVPFEGQIVVEDNATAVRLARQASADLAVRGAAQVVGDHVRLTAQLIDAKTGNTVNTAMATGPVRDLLQLEDQLSAQLRGVAMSATAAAPATMPMEAAAAVPPQVPQIIIVPSSPSAPTTYYPYDYSAYDSSSYYNSPYSYPYGYGGYYPYYPLIISSGVGFDHRHDHDHGHGGGSGGHGSTNPGHGGGAVGGHAMQVQAAGGNSFALPLPRSLGLPLPANSFGTPRFSPAASQSNMGSRGAGNGMGAGAFVGMSSGMSAHESMGVGGTGHGGGRH